jgi:hypothetical protein
VNPPTTVRLGVVLTITSLLAGLVGFIVNQVVPATDIRIVVWLAIVGLVTVVFWGWIARRTWQGRSWARMLQTVLLAWGIAVTIFDAFQVTLAFDWLDVVLYVVSAGAVVLLWTPTSRSYFAATTAARRRQKTYPNFKKPMKLR